MERVVSLILFHRRSGIGISALVLSVCGGCGVQAPETAEPTFRFAVLGDAPYGGFEAIRFRRVIRQLDAADLEVVIHVGDVFWYPCSDDHFRERVADFGRQRHPLVYTPGDNEWTDCHERIAGGYQPLERLDRLREIFYADPARGLGGTAMSLAVQSADSAWGEFVENARWSEAGIVFSTVHLVGSKNGLADYPGRSSRSDLEAARRTAAATVWMEAAFAHADSVRAVGIVIAMHADPDFEGRYGDYGEAYEPFLRSLEQAVEAFGGPVLLVHGDNHEYTIDHPLRQRETGRILDNLIRLEVFGSPAVGWVEVAVDTSAAELFRFTPHHVPRWMVW